MDPNSVVWLPDGFRVRFDSRTAPGPLRADVALMAATVVAVIASVSPAAALPLFLPAMALAWTFWGRAEAQLEVTHDTLVVSAPWRRTLRVSLREVRKIDVFDDVIELTSWSGSRTRVAAPKPGPQLQWIVRQIKALRDDTQRFALEMAEHLDEAAQVKRLLPVTGR